MRHRLLLMTLTLLLIPLWAMAQYWESGTTRTNSFYSYTSGKNHYSKTEVSYLINVEVDGQVAVAAVPIDAVRINSISLYAVNGDEHIFMGSGGDAMVIDDVAVGTYLVKITGVPTDSKGYGGNFVATYFFTPAAYVSDPEPNNTWDKAILLQNGDVQHGHLGFRFISTDVVDWYKIVVPDEGTVTLSTNTSTTLRLGNLEIRALNEAGDGVVYRTGKGMDGQQKDTTVVFTLPDIAPGTYYIQLNRWLGYGSYTLKYNFTPSPYQMDEDGNDSWNTATELNLDTPVQGRLGYSFLKTDVVDWYKIVVPEDGKLTLMTKTETTLRLGNLEIRELNEVGDGVVYRTGKGMDGQQKDSTVVFEVPNVAAGTYFLQMNRWLGYGGYDFTCYFTRHADEADPEPNNDWTTAVELKNGPAVTGQLGYETQGVTDVVDWYRLVVPKEGAIVLSTNTEKTLRLGNLEIRTLNAAGDGVVYRTGKGMDGQQKDTTVVFTIPDAQPGVYYVQLNRWLGYGTYHLQYIFNPNARQSDPEPNDTWDKASLIESDVPQEGCLGYSYSGYTDTRDYFKIVVPDEGTVTLSTTTDPTLRLGNLEIQALKTSGDAIQFRTSRGMDGQQKDTTVVFTLPDMAPGIYYVQLNRWLGYGGYKLDYVFTPNVHGQDADDNDSWDKATAIEAGTTQEGRLGYSYLTTDYVDWFKIEVPDEGTVTLSTTTEKTLRLGNMEIRTLNADGEGVTYRTGKGMDGQQKDTTVVFTLPDMAPGTYYIQLNRWLGYGGYKLKYVFTPDVYGPDSNDNDSWDKATVIEAGSLQQGRLGYSYRNTDGVDWYKFEVPYVGDVTLSVTSEKSLRLGNMEIRTLNANGDGVTYRTGRGMDGEQKDTTIVFNLNGLGAGTYYIQQHRWIGYGGYSIKYNFERNPYDRDGLDNGSFATRVRLEEGKMLSTTLGYTYNEQNNEDWYDLGMMHGRQIDVTLSPDTTHTLVIGVPALYIYKGDNENGSPILTKVAESRIERSQGTISYIDTNEEDQHYVFRVPNYNSRSYGGYTILFGEEQESGLVESNINVLTQGRNTVRKGVACENPITITNTSTRKTLPFVLAIAATEDIDIVGFRIRGRYGNEFIPIDSLTSIGDSECEHTVLFFVPGLNPWESYTFTMISEGKGDIAYAPRSTRYSTGRNKIIINSTSYVVVAAMGYVTDTMEGKRLKDYLCDKLAAAYGLGMEERLLLEQCLNHAIQKLNAEKQQNGVAVYSVRDVIRKACESLAELLPGVEFASMNEMPCHMITSFRQRLWKWIYKDLEYMVDDIAVLDGKAAITDIVASWDPNEMVGPAGVGEQHYVGQIKTVNYRILFENKAEAGASANRVRITDELDPNVFDVTSVRFGDTSHDGVGYNWVTKREGNTLSWDITGIELPPNVNAPEGEGYVSFSVDLLPDLANGTLVKNQATIIFDKNTPIVTNEYVNTIDLLPPTTTMAAASYNPDNGNVSVVFESEDEGAGLQCYYLFVSKDNGEYTCYGQSVTGEINYPIAQGEDGNYSFFVLATDNVGNTERVIPEAVSVATDIKGVRIATDPDASMRIYTIDGRYVGDSVSRLSKGVYVVGGRKIIIK